MTAITTLPGLALLPRVAAICAARLGVDAAQVTPAALLTDDLNLDALDAIDVVIALEDAFGIEITDLELTALAFDPQTVADLLALLHAKGAL